MIDIHQSDGTQIRIWGFEAALAWHLVYKTSTPGSMLFAETLIVDD